MHFDFLPYYKFFSLLLGRLDPNTFFFIYDLAFCWLIDNTLYTHVFKCIYFILYV